MIHTVNNVAYTQKDSGMVVNLLCRNEGGEFKRIDVPYRPYCYVRESDAEEMEKPASVTGVEKGHETFPDKEEVVKIYFRTPSDVKNFRFRCERDLNIETFESDIPLGKRFLIDKRIRAHFSRENGELIPSDKDVSTKLRVLYLDIEVKVPQTANINTLTDRAEYPIVAIGYCDSYNEEIRSITAEDKTEKKLLNSFVEAVQSIKPDVIVVYNEEFDIPYLLKRMIKNNIPIGRLSPLRRIKFNDRTNEFRFKGVTILDYSKVYRDFIGREIRTSWFQALDTLAKKHLGVQKIPIEDFSKTWNLNPQKIRQRVMLDVAILVELEKKLELLKLFDLVRKEVGCLLEDVFFKSRISDMALIREVKDKGVLPNKGRRGNSNIQYTGAFVLEPKPGVYKDVHLADFDAFYPSIICLYNISPETYSPDDGDLIVKNSLRFSSKKEGIVPKMIKKYLNIKDSVKRARDNAREKGNMAEYELLNTRHMAIKVIINGMYGCLSYASRLSSLEVAEAVTTGARLRLKEAMEIVKRLGGEVVYSDSDSLFFINNTHISASEFVGRINQYMPEGLNLSLDRKFDSIIFMSKKRYIGIDAMGAVVKRGIQSARSDVERLIMETQDRLLLDMLGGRSKSSILGFMRNVVRMLNKEEVEPEQLGRPIQLKKEIDKYKVKSFHIKGIEFSKKYFDNIEFYPGNKVVVYKIIDKGTSKWMTINTNMKLPSEMKLDYSYYKERLKSVVEPILHLVGIKWNHLETRTLDSFKAI